MKALVKVNTRIFGVDNYMKCTDLSTCLGTVNRVYAGDNYFIPFRCHQCYKGSRDSLFKKEK